MNRYGLPVLRNMLRLKCTRCSLTAKRNVHVALKEPEAKIFLQRCFSTQVNPFQKERSKLFQEELAIMNALEFYGKVARILKDPSLELIKEDCVEVSKECWRYEVKVNWPWKGATVVGGQYKKKKIARRDVYFKLLDKLWSEDWISSDLAPCILTSEEVRRINHQRAMRVHMTEESIEKVRKLVKEYNEHVKQKLVEASENDWFNETTCSGVNVGKIDIQRDEIRNEELLERLCSAPQKVALPVDKYKSSILSAINSERTQVTILTGATGSGKSTRVPCMILDELTEKERGSECNVIVSVPRRISATSLARRVARERGEEVGDVVGYSIRMEHIIPEQKGSILYATTGTVLKMMSNNQVLNRYSHIIIDEVHERKAETDFLLLLMKDYLQHDRNRRLILMSATADHKKFLQYFGDANVIDIPVQTYSVQSVFFDAKDIRQVLKCTPLEDADKPILHRQAFMRLIVLAHRTEPPGTILGFLPKVHDIVLLKSMLSVFPDLHVQTLHSRLPIKQQDEVFSQPPKGKRVVVLATNIAEVSITIPGVICVVDSGLENSARYNSETQITNFEVCWISKSSVKQRKGRAGRTNPGKCFHLYSKTMYNEFEDNSICEIACVPLLREIMCAKLFTTEKAENFLSRLIEPPEKKRIHSALEDLKCMKLLDGDENLTVAGKRIVGWMIDPKLSSVLLYAVFFKCVDPILTIVSNVSDRADAYCIDDGDAAARRKLKDAKQRFSPSSDYLAHHKVYALWENMFSDEVGDHRKYVGVNFQEDMLMSLQKYRESYRELLEQNIDLSEAKTADYNTFAECAGVVNSVFMKGFRYIFKSQPQVLNRLGGAEISFQDQSGNIVTLSDGSLFHGQKDYKIRLYNTAHVIKKNENRVTVHNCNYVTALMAILFHPDVRKPREEWRCVSDHHLYIHFPLEVRRPSYPDVIEDYVMIDCGTPEMAQALFELREIIQSTFTHFLRTTLPSCRIRSDDRCKEFAETLVDTVNSMINYEMSHDLSCDNPSKTI